MCLDEENGGTETLFSLRVSVQLNWTTLGNHVGLMK